jgi:hypothetical protein
LILHINVMLLDEPGRNIRGMIINLCMYHPLIASDIDANLKRLYFILRATRRLFKLYVLALSSFSLAHV